MKYLQFHGRTGYLLPRTEGRNAQHYSRYRLVKYEIFTRGEIQRLIEKGYDFPASRFDEIAISQFTDEYFQNLSTIVHTPARDYGVVRSVRFPSPEHRLEGDDLEQYQKGLYLNEKNENTK